MTKVGTVRPRIAIAARRAESTSASRRSAVVISERLAEAVWLAGGEPLIYYPTTDGSIAERMEGIAGVLIPGGGDVDPSFYGQRPSTDSIYGVDKLVDSFDLALSDHALKNGIPLLAICRGAQVINVLRGGTLIQDLETPHRDHMHDIKVFADANELGLHSDVVRSSCFHHQAIDQLGNGLEVIARSDDGLVEAFRIEAKSWAYAVQWHPEDNFHDEASQLGIFKKFVTEASGIDVTFSL
jgi:putative glutamine amidotransferase